MTTSAVRRTWSATKMRASRRSSTRPTRSSRCWRRRRSARSGSCGRSRRTRMPTTSPATGASRSSTACRSRSTRLRRRRTSTIRWTDGAEVALGDVVLRAIHTPGHRPEHTCLAVIDRSRADEPWLVLTGDSLFVGDAARPDLAVGAQEGAEGLFHSLRRLLELPDGVEVFPGHVAGSLCGKAMSSKGSSTIGFERRFNPALQIEHEADFVADSASVSAPKPPNMTRLVELNRGPHVGAAADVVELPMPPAGATVLDVRPARAFLDGHGHGVVERARVRPLVRDEVGVPARCRDADRRPGVERGGSRARRSRSPLRRLSRARGLRARRRPGADRGGRASTSSTS